jgi:hypothetical protein
VLDGSNSIWAGVKQPGDVLEEDEAGSYLANHPSDGRPDPALVVGAAPGSCDADGLAGEAGGDEIDSPGELVHGEPLEVAAPHRCRIQALVLHTREEHGRSEGVPLAVSHHSCVGEHGADSEVEPADAGTEREHGESHVTGRPRSRPDR